MEKKVYVLGGVDFSDKAARWFVVLNRKVGSSAHYECTNSDQWGRDFGHTGYIVADDDDDLETGLEILQSSDKLIFEKGDAMTLSHYWCKKPARGVKIVLNEKRQALATKVADKLNLTSAQWARLGRDLGSILRRVQKNPKAPKGVSRISFFILIYYIYEYVVLIKLRGELIFAKEYFMKFVEKMFNKGSGSSCKIGDINRDKDHTEVLLGIVDSTFKDHGDGDVEPIFSLSDADIVETDNSWHLNSFDGFDSWVSVSKWIDFTDLDGDSHHAKLTRCWDPDNPTDIHYYLEVDLLSES